MRQIHEHRRTAGRPEAGAFVETTVSATDVFPTEELTARRSWPARPEDALMLGDEEEPRRVRLRGLGPTGPAAGASREKLVEFTVAGEGRFPLDMLRYSRSWPARPEDARSVVPAEGNLRQVRLVGLGPHAPERWRSFGWSVVGKTSRAEERVAS